ncbi:creatininase family protein [Azospirillum sp. 412522]|nr:creatininase family protein [Azospirillum sp. 412522]MBY6262638.1 creatininase family protein [Azospirillum sp. 412522]
MTIPHNPIGAADAPGNLQWSHLTAPALRDLAARGALVLLPVGSVEQHGPHLPTGVDDMLCKAVCLKAADLIAEHRPVVVAPSVWCGLADHHLEFGGTFTLSLGTYHALLREICGSIAGAGFRQIVIVNGHGGNCMALGALTGELARELSIGVATTTYFMEAFSETGRILEDQASLLHACEGETSMMMALAPSLVDPSRLDEAHGPAFDMISSMLPSLRVFRSFADLTPSGVSGDARRATPEKGRAILDACAQALARRLLAGEPWRP